MIYHDIDLFYDMYNKISVHNPRQIDYVLLVQKIFLSKSKSSFLTSSASSLILISMLSLFECIIYGRNKFILMCQISLDYL